MKIIIIILIIIIKFFSSEITSHVARIVNTEQLQHSIP
jgi:hypothetical protein